MGQACLSLSQYARDTIDLEPVFDHPTVKEFAVRTNRPASEVVAAARKLGVHPGYAVGAEYPGMDDVLLVAVTEQRTRGGHRPAGAGAGRGGRMKLIYERSQAGRRASSIPHPDVPLAELPAEYARARPPRLAELAEPELVRHFTELSTRTFGIDTGFYPLGSCTMKHNPRVSERLVNLPGFRDLHPHQSDDGAQGALELMWRLERMLADVVGLDAVSLQPAAGSQGELTGLTIMRAHFIERGEDDTRREVVIPDTAHGTNPASVAMAGYTLVHVKTDDRGNIDIDDLRTLVGPHTAGLMLTNPSTLGLFEENITEIADIFHSARGAPVLRRCQPECGVRHLPARRHGLRHPALQSAQDVRPAAWRRRPGWWPGGRARDARAVPARHP